MSNTQLQTALSLFDLPQQQIEIWKDIEGYEGYYQISNHGRVKSLDRYSMSKDKQMRLYKGKLLKPGNISGTYKMVCFCKKQTIKQHVIHRLVAQTFILNPENKPDVNHIDGNPSNNYLLNLEWCTEKENILHAYYTGLHKRYPGIEKKSKLTSTDRNNIIRLSLEGDKPKNIANSYNVHLDTIYKLIRRTKSRKIKIK